MRTRKPPRLWPYDHHPTPNDPVFRGNPHFERHIYILRDQVLYDIDAQVSIIAKVRRKPDDSEDNTLTDITEQYKPLFHRWIDKYINLAKGRMAAFILEPFKTAKTNTLDTNEIDIELQVPDYWDDTMFQPLSQAVHDFVVNGALYEFATLTLPPKEHIINVKRTDMEESYSDIKKYICATKPGTIRRPLQPF